MHLKRKWLWNLSPPMLRFMFWSELSHGFCTHIVILLWLFQALWWGFSLLYYTLFTTEEYMHMCVIYNLLIWYKNLNSDVMKNMLCTSNNATVMTFDKFSCSVNIAIVIRFLVYKWFLNITLHLSLATSLSILKTSLIRYVVYYWAVGSSHYSTFQILNKV